MRIRNKTHGPATEAVRGRGSASFVDGRYQKQQVRLEDDGWDGLQALADEQEPRLETVVTPEQARSVISRNQSPDVGFDQSVNPYRGCEHGCVYCFARPSHAYLDLSPGLDFETRLYAKTNAAERLREELAKPSYRCSPIALGINTDGYQPVERRWRVTRELLEVLSECRHPCSIVTKGALVTRDLDLLAPMAAQGLVTVYLSITTLDNRLSARMEPRAAAPHARLASRSGCWWRRWCRRSPTPSWRRSWKPRASTAPARPATCCCACRTNSRRSGVSGWSCTIPIAHAT